MDIVDDREERRGWLEVKVGTKSGGRKNLPLLRDFYPNDMQYR
jgi:hypothetical protein